MVKDINEIEIFSRIEESRIGKIRALFSARRFDKGTVVIEHGKPVDGLYLLERGGVSDATSYQHDAFNRQQRIDSQGSMVFILLNPLVMLRALSLKLEIFIRRQLKPSYCGEAQSDP